MSIPTAAQLHTLTIDKPVMQATVIGAGSMGSGIAALLASNGVKVLLLDVPGEGSGSDRNAPAQRGVDIQLKRKGFTHPDFADNITVGNTEDDLAKVADSQWIVEAVFENLEVKKKLYAQLEKHVAEGALLTSNTSTIPLAQLTEDMGPQLAGQFVITHFFNPPRVMNLVEVVPNDKVAPEKVQWIWNVLEGQLGKVPLMCRDTPGFIANRIGNLWMAVAAKVALDNNIAPELADAVNQKIFQTPRTGAFGLFDYIGLQLVPDVWGSFIEKVPEHDAYHRYPVHNHTLFTGLIERGLTGRTGESGVFRGREEVIDVAAVPAEFNYRQRQALDDPALSASTPVELMETDSPAGQYARAIFAETIAYCAATGPEITDTVEGIDAAMRHGYSWRRGPLQLADAYGIRWVRDIVAQHLQTTGREVPQLLEAAVKAGGFYPSDTTVLATTGEVVGLPDVAGVVTVGDLREQHGTFLANDKAFVVRLPSGVGVWATSTKKGSLSSEAIALLCEAIDAAVAGELTALVLASNDPTAFCAGADLSTLAHAGTSGDAECLEKFLRLGLDTLTTLRIAPVPVVAAVQGYAVGGGAEMLLHTDAAVFHQDAIIGFPERNVGLFPGWNGAVRTLQRMQAAGVDDAAQKAFDLNVSAKLVRGAYPWLGQGVGTQHDRVVAQGGHVLAQAIELSEELSRNYAPPVEQRIVLSPTPLDGDWADNPQASDVDKRIAHAVSELLTGDNPQGATVAELTEKNIALCVPLLLHPDNAARAQHMVDTGKPLKN